MNYTQYSCCLDVVWFVVCGCHRTYERGQHFLARTRKRNAEDIIHKPTHKPTRSPTHSLTLTRTNGFVIDPLSFVPNVAIGVGFGAPAVGHSVPPLSPIAPSILPGTGSESIVSAVLPGSLVLASVRKGVLAVALSLSIDKVSVVHGPVRPGKDSLSVALVLRKLAVVDPAVVPVIDAGAVALVVLVLSLVRVTVGKGRPAVSVPAAVAPIALKDPVVLLVDHAAQSVRHARVPQDDTRVRALVAVGIQQDFVHHLDPFVSKGRAGNRLSHGFVVEGREVALAVLRARRDVDGIEAIGGRRLVLVAVVLVVAAAVPRLGWWSTAAQLCQRSVGVRAERQTDRSVALVIISPAPAFAPSGTVMVVDANEFLALVGMNRCKIHPTGSDHPLHVECNHQQNHQPRRSNRVSDSSSSMLWLWL
mmetsp:Transcript_5749/g.14279  ORF Transcript_5749/g.14279 Transcript_5749/m.14279 type:complete len:419 (+) Transcript_5749:81-1337(+)